MDKPRFVLDSTIIIQHLNKEIDVAAFFGAIPACERFVSIVTEIEVLSDPAMTEDEEKEARKLLKHFDSIDILPAIKEETVKIRRAFKLRLPDAVIAATAVILNATLLSNDPHHLKKLVWPGYQVQAI
jgi:predicted nucleic acid-binding protein